MDHSVFISYSSKDKAAADQICAALEAAGHGCWIAPRDIEAGTIPYAILSAVGQARCVVVIVSAAAEESPHILTEIEHAFSEKKPIVPFRISNAALPPKFDYFLSLSQWLDAHEGCTPANLARLNEAVGSRAVRGARSRRHGNGSAAPARSGRRRSRPADRPWAPSLIGSGPPAAPRPRSSRQSTPPPIPLRRRSPKRRRTRLPSPSRSRGSIPRTA